MCVIVIRFCHQLTVKGKCHHGRKSDIEPERTEKSRSIGRSRERVSYGETGSWGNGSIIALNEKADSRL